MRDTRLKTNSSPSMGTPLKSDHSSNIINKLRFLMISCRIESRITLDEACKLIQVDKKKSARFFAYSILRTLDEALGKPPVFRLPGETNLSFDEEWLSKIIASFGKNDQISIKFLLSSRVENINKRSYMYFLLDGLVQDIDSL